MKRRQKMPVKAVQFQLLQLNENKKKAPYAENRVPSKVMPWEQVLDLLRL